MRPLIVLALVLAACTRGEQSSPPVSRTASAASPLSHAPDALVLRVPRHGGVAHVTTYPDIDSVVWTSTESAPELARVIAFDRDAGLIAAVDSKDAPVFVDLRQGSVTVATPRRLHDLTSIDGSTVYGIGVDGAVARFTPSGNWVFKPPQPARAVFPQPGGMLLVLGGRGDTTRVWRIRPPATRILDSLVVAGGTVGVGAPLGERLYIASNDRHLIGVRPRTLTETGTIEFKHAITGIATTPSGDRFYVITDSSKTLTVVDPYRDRASDRIDLPGQPREVRVDPDGRFVLVRAASGDSVWVLAVGTDRVIGAVHTDWRGDVPFVAPDGDIGVENGADIVFLEAPTFREVQRVPNGASEFWYPFVWDGLRPRAVALDTPATFPSDTATAAQAVVAPPRDTAVAKPMPIDSARIGFTVSFTVQLDQGRARDLASKINVNGQAARVVTNMNNGMAVYRVVLGPYTTRDEAERIGRSSGQPYYVYAGTP